MPKLFATFALLTIFLTGCDQQKFLALFTPKDQDAAARQYIEDLRRGGVAAIHNSLDPSLQTPALGIAFTQVRDALFPGAMVKSLKLVSSQTISQGNITSYDFGYEYEFPTSWRYVNIALRKTGDVTKIVGIHAQLLPASLEQINAFNFGSKKAIQIILLLIGILIGSFSIVTAIFCWKTPIPKRKWLWIIFVLVGFGQLTLNWTTGEFGLQLLAVNLFGFGLVQQSYGPWMLQMGLPVGAIMFWLRRRKWLLAANQVAAP